MTGLLFCLSAMAASADERPQGTASGPYVTFSVHRVASFTLHTTSATLSPARIRSRPGYQLGAGVGYRVHNTRVEGHLVYGRFDADRIRFGEGGGSLSGYFDLRGVTLELIRDFLPGATVRPYLGVGVGLIRFRANHVTLAGFPPTEGANTLLSYQVAAGVAYSLAPWRFTLAYRYLGMGKQDFTTGGDTIHADPLRTDAIQVGVQLAF